MSAENIINNPPKEFTEPCEACGVSEFQLGVKHTEERIIKLLIDLNVVRRDALGSLVAFNTDGTEVVYLTGLET